MAKFITLWNKFLLYFFFTLLGLFINLQVLNIRRNHMEQTVEVVDTAAQTAAAAPQNGFWGMVLYCVVVVGEK